MPFLIHKSRLFFCVETNKLTRISLSRTSIVFSDSSEHWFSSLFISNICENLCNESDRISDVTCQANIGFWWKLCIQDTGKILLLKDLVFQFRHCTFGFLVILSLMSQLIITLVFQRIKLGKDEHNRYLKDCKYMKLSRKKKQQVYHCQFPNQRMFFLPQRLGVDHPLGHSTCLYIR